LPSLKGTYPASVELDDAWILRDLVTAEPSTLTFAVAVLFMLSLGRRRKRPCRSAQHDQPPKNDRFGSL
jgi:hypothetical protein